MKVAVLFDHFGPYHRARLRGAMEHVEAVGLEFYPQSRDYAWESSDDGQLPITTVMDAPKMDGFKKGFPARLAAILSAEKPDAVAIPGWSSFEALTALQWCRTHGVPPVLMSESSAHDTDRSAMKEWVKRQIVRAFPSALVGGSPHRAYLRQLGMAEDRIFTGYDVVDNAYFEEASDDARRQRASSPGPTGAFLASNRFIEKKNLLRVIDAYAAYRSRWNPTDSEPAWNLCLLGDGELRPALEARMATHRLEACVEMPGFKQYDELPSYYAKASCFLHASTTEQWGLVVNEAMASGLPVLVSNRCGCAPDLVQDNVNGFTFDPFDTESLASAMLAMHRLSAEARQAMGRASREIIRQWGPDRFGTGLRAAARSASAHAPQKTLSLRSTLIIKTLLRS